MTYKIDFHDIAKQSGVRKGKLFFSATFKSWCVSGGDASIAIIEPPKQNGNLPVKIENDYWIY